MNAISSRLPFLFVSLLLQYCEMPYDKWLDMFRRQYWKHPPTRPQKDQMLSVVYLFNIFAFCLSDHLEKSVLETAWLACAFTNNPYIPNCSIFFWVLQCISSKEDIRHSVQ